MKAVSIVTIKSFSPMYKGDEEASNIQIADVEEHDFDIVVQKELYQIGDKVVYIQPDFCLSNIPLFAGYIAPQGDPKKSKLGKQNRIKAVKFGFTDSRGNKVYSNGILLPLDGVEHYLAAQTDYLSGENEVRIFDVDLDAALDITKYEEPEGKLNGDAKGNLPNGLYKTDETNFNNVSKKLVLPTQIIGSLKIDGSSISVFFRSETEYGICSRALEKKLFSINYPEWEKHFNKDLMILGKLNKLSGEFVADSDWNAYLELNEVISEETLAQDDWVQLGYPILEKLKAYGKPLVVRGEIFGQSLKGSGNKSNPHAKLPKSIRVFGIDDYSSGIAIPLPMKEVIELCKELDLPMVDIIFNQLIETVEELKTICEDYFKDNLVEGIVVRTYNINAFSAKYLNNEYDSKK